MYTSDIYGAAILCYMSIVLHRDRSINEKDGNKKQVCYNKRERKLRGEGKVTDERGKVFL